MKLNVHNIVLFKLLHKIESTGEVKCILLRTVQQALWKLTLAPKELPDS